MKSLIFNKSFIKRFESCRQLSADQSDVPAFRRGIFVLERCGACSGKSAETKMGVSVESGHHFDLASPT